MNRKWRPRIVFTFVIALSTAIVTVGIISTLNSSTPKPAMNETILKCKIQQGTYYCVVSTEGEIYHLSLSEWALVDIPICGFE